MYEYIQIYIGIVVYLRTVEDAGPYKMLRFSCINRTLNKNLFFHRTHVKALRSE